MHECNFCQSIVKNFEEDWVNLPRDRQLFNTLVDMDTIETQKCQKNFVCLPKLRIKNELKELRGKRT